MQYVNLGRTGAKVSRIGLGMMTFGDARWRPWVLGIEEARPIVRRAVELGINFFDTADMYSAGASEEITGRLVREFCDRDEVIVATKVHHPVDLRFSGGTTVGARPVVPPNKGGQSRKRIMAAIDASLTRLGLDYVDLYQIHRFDYHTPMDEVMEALRDVVKAGKARYIGASSMWTWQFAKMQFIAQSRGLTPFVSMQNHYNLAYREEEREMIPFCRDQGVAVTPWSPLARGFLAGNRKRDDKTAAQTGRAQTDEMAHAYYYRDADFDVVDAVGRVAAARGVKPAEIAYAWLLSRPGVTAPIVGASKVWQIEEAVKALDVALAPEELKALEAPYQPHNVLGHV
jgi:1-deoxyxylulose-5-phosphate synthase